MEGKQNFDIEERRELAKRLASLADEALTISDDPEERIAIELGTESNKNVMTVHKHQDRASFFIRSKSLLDELTGANLKFEHKASQKARDEDWYRIYKLRIDHVNENEDLFKRIVRESVEILKERKSKKN